MVLIAYPAGLDDGAREAAGSGFQSAPAAGARSGPLTIALIALPLVVGFVAAARALSEFAYGSPIYGPGGHPWAYGEWVISYASGFVRRGLSGEILIPLIGLTGSAAVPYLLAAGLPTAIVAAALFLRYRRHGGTEAALMLYLPTSALFPLWDYNMVGRKEQLVLATTAVVALLAARRMPAATAGSGLGLGLVLAALIPFHEGLLFFMPLLFVLMELGRGPTPPADLVRRFAAVIGPPALAFAAVLLASGPIDTAPLFSAVPEYGEGMRAWCLARGVGSICWLGFDPGFVVAYVYRIGPEGVMRGLAMVIAQGALVTAVYLRVSGLAPDRRTLLLLAFGWTCVLPLYLVAFDWGRWNATVALMFALMTPLGPAARPLGAARLIGIAAVLSMFTVGHLQSQGFEAGGPLLLWRARGWLLSAVAPTG